ncbi:MAG: thiamine biosynthesis lipoprotein [Psychromonas sp.]|jgi:thiamine biosynthesis lipoprotein|uniref:FAD:protein FMN transferase n=1 Tax=Psychromonas sp. TaxID=1884585 RepID=UPI0039E24322
MVKSLLHWLALTGLAFFVSSCVKTESTLLHIQGQTMGTYYQVKYVLDTNQQNNKKLSIETLQAEIDKRLELVNDQMSTYRPDSELSRFNRAEKSLIVSDATRRVVEDALLLFKQSNGAYDITVGPLVNIWGFGPDKKPNKVPSDELIAEKRKIVGSQYLSVEGNRLSKSIPELYLDLSSIAKGYGVDLIADYLQQLGINNYLVDIGGELRVHGFKPANEQWTLAIERPVAGQNVQRLIHIGDNAIATSGDYRNYFESDGIRYSHTIDPQTGKPINHKLVSVTVIDKSSMHADGLATAITVLGPTAGLAFAKEQHLPVFLLVKAGDDFIEQFTSEFEPYFLEEK